MKKMQLSIDSPLEYEIEVTMKNNDHEFYSKIGIFDSGFGGLTIFKHIRQCLPNYDYIYLGDNARTPYGNRSFEAVLKFTEEGVGFLFSKGCRLVIVACNTASARALRTLQQQWLPNKFKNLMALRVLGVIRPTIENISKYTHSHTIALWATPGTVKSESFILEARHFAPEVNIIQTSCPLLVPLVEAGELSGAGVDYFIEKYWLQTSSQMGGGGIDTLLLACTHYPLLLREIQKMIPQEIRILTQGELVAKSLENYLFRHDEMATQLSQGKTTQFFTTDQCDYFDHLAEIFMGDKIFSQMAEYGW